MAREKLKQGSVAEVLLKISALAQILPIDFRDGQAMSPKVAREFQKGNILFAHIVQDPDRAQVCAAAVGGQPHDLSPRPAELPLQRLHTLRRHTKMPLEQLSENFHAGD